MVSIILNKIYYNIIILHIILYIITLDVRI